MTPMFPLSKQLTHAKSNSASTTTPFLFVRLLYSVWFSIKLSETELNGSHKFIMNVNKVTKNFLSFRIFPF